MESQFAVLLHSLKVKWYFLLQSFLTNIDYKEVIRGIWWEESMDGPLEILHAKY